MAIFKPSFSHTRWELISYLNVKDVIGAKKEAKVSSKNDTLQKSIPNKRLGITPYLRFHKINWFTGNGECEWNFGCNYYRSRVHIGLFLQRIKIDTDSTQWERTLIDCNLSQDETTSPNEKDAIAEFWLANISRFSFYKRDKDFSTLSDSTLQVSAKVYDEDTKINDMWNVMWFKKDLILTRKKR
jgi:hypothetical protein